jgi:16S rRNA (guanine(966)-N(2))-methyltransferase RsmD
MRIITGKARGVRLLTLDGDATRPTAERAKEAVFSMLQFELEGRTVLDLFGGSGQLGLEALSRGAKSAVIADSSKEAINIIKKNVEKTKLNDCRVLLSDWKESLRRLKGEKFDIVFLAPPYAMSIIPSVLNELLPSLKQTSIVVCESGYDLSDDIPKEFEIIKNAKYGVAYVTIVRPERWNG